MTNNQAFEPVDIGGGYVASHELAAQLNDPKGQKLVQAIHDRRACTCTNRCSENYEDNDCAHCRSLNIYAPCRIVGFGCGQDCGDDEHCTPEQQRAADS